ncbi:MAG: phosphoribosylformylglycinamidine cyclo-ligase [Candidatus Aminicenantes bacterium]|nr:phosphoribosylformylglycinamidine cyclo-ligase [Candidatus Aminicenantes bacterium]
MAKSVYAKAGVDIDKGNEAVKKIKAMVKGLGVKEIGKFSGFFPLKQDLEHPVLVSSADGVGTKLKIAFLMGKHNTVGQDLVNHCVNDILVYGAKPLFFLDYIAAGKVKPDTVSDIVSGILEGCVENDFVLLGGETAEMPGFYKKNEYDLAGFIVGLVDKKKIVDGKKIKKGDLLVGLPSTGLHTNGYSLARHIFFKKLKLKVDSLVEGLPRSIGEELLAVHRSYLKPAVELVNRDLIKGMAHITGGGFIDNIPRTLPENTAVQVERIWPVPEIFNFLCDAGKVGEQERYRVFNMGIGMVLIIDSEDLSKVEKTLNSLDEKYYLIGQVVEKKGKAQIKIN